MPYSYCGTVATMLAVTLLVLLAANSTNTSQRMCSKAFPDDAAIAELPG